MAPPFALPPPDFPLPAYVRQAESGLWTPRQAVLPGLYLPPGLMGGASSLTLSLYADAEDVGDTLTLPSGIQAGDLIILYLYLVEGFPSVPSGYTSVGETIIGQFGGLVLAYKVAAGTEGGDTIPMGTGFYSHAVVLRASRPISSASHGGRVNVVTNSNPAAQTIIMSGTTPPVLGVGLMAVESGSVTSPTATPPWGITSDASHSRIGVTLFTASPSNILFDMGDGGSGNNLVGCWIELGL